MMIFGRHISQYTKNLRHMHKYVWYCVKCCLLFKRPLVLLYHYLTRTSPPQRTLELRRGMRIGLSAHPDDVITVFLIFVREDYGRVAPGSVVVDIGANIGVFALYAAYCGARRVYAYEPNGQSHAHLLQNIERNRLENVINARKLAVSDTAGQNVRFPVQSSVYNAIIRDARDGDWEDVQTTTLAQIIADEALEVIDLLKIDCEGEEYTIIPASGENVWRRVRSIAIEYHQRHERLVTFFASQRFRAMQHKQDTERTGSLRLERLPK
jgi:FkbM family methyltransferase